MATGRRRRSLLLPVAACVLAILAHEGAGAQDALQGKRLYLDVGRLRGSGVSCVDCHGGYPGALHGIGKAAGNPNAIAYALGAISQMTPLRGRLTDNDMADLAAYFAQSSVLSPEPVLTTEGPAASAYSAERLEFADGRAGARSPASLVRLTNRGAVPLAILSAPALAGPAAQQFAITATDCRAGTTLTAGQSCTIGVVFDPEGPPGLRAARLGLSHDWIGGGVNVALIGRVSP